jgi:cell volume regulation protein A
VAGKVFVRDGAQVVTLALAVILFDGGMRMGWQRFRSAAVATVWIGVAGTFVTAAAVAMAARLLFSFGWHAALLIGAALAPTDPAVVFPGWAAAKLLGAAVSCWKGRRGPTTRWGSPCLLRC